MTSRNYKLYFPSWKIIIKTDILANITNHYKEGGYKGIKSSKMCFQCVISGDLEVFCVRLIGLFTRSAVSVSWICGSPDSW